MDDALLGALRAFVAAHPRATLLDVDEAEQLRARVAARFALPGDRIWWWEHAPASARVVPYRDQEGLALLARALPGDEPHLRMFVTDDEPPPWPCLTAPADVLLALIREHRFFEFFVVDPALRWIVFDTHHNTLVVLGEGLEVTAEPAGASSGRSQPS